MKNNAITRRMQRLSDQWRVFTDDQTARLLCWQLDHDEVQMFDTWLEVESDEQSAQHPDVFVTLQTPFVDRARHGFALAETFRLGLQDGETELRDLGLRHALELPAPDADATDIAHWIDRCEAFRSYYAIGGLLVLVLRPSGVSDREAYRAWLHALSIALPREVRTIILDDARNPAFIQLCANEHAQVRTALAALDMPRALEELSRDAGHLDTPGGQFRDLFVRLGNALAKPDLASALALGDAALALTREQSLWHLSVPVHFALASGLLAHARAPEAVAHYRAAKTRLEKRSSKAATKRTRPHN
ncbi:MAG TPA: hypothetical protein VGI70_14665 [Polyangiales bacterium]|jgi:hypothetical protein